MGEGRPRLGVIGVGAMGEPMARNLARAGYPLVFCTRRESAATSLSAVGGQRLPDAAAVAAASDVVLTCLPADAEIEAVVLGEEGVLRHLRPGGVLIELSTATPMRWSSARSPSRHGSERLPSSTHRSAAAPAARWRQR